MKRNYTPRKEKEQVCQNCEKTYQTKALRSQYCSTLCRSQAKIKRKIKDENLIENEDYLICQWDNGITMSSLKKYINKNFENKNWDDYIKEFPDTLKQPLIYTKKTTKNSGQHMKNEKYKIMFSEKVKGEKNPNHSSKVSEKTRKSRSPFSKDFLKYDSEKDRKKFLESVDYDNRITATQLDWWVKKYNGDIESATEAYKERQKTFTLEKCIQKYGEVEGKKRFAKRQEKWKKNFKKSNFSKISQELYWSLYEKIKNENWTFYFAEYNKGEKNDSGKNHEYTLKLESSAIKPDFYIPELKKIIEFDGVYWHRKNPENKKREEKRDKEILKAGYKVLHVSERNYKENPEKEIQKCLEFLRKDD